VFLTPSCAKNDSVEIAETIIERETGDHSWSLMHRFNLATDLLDRLAPESPQELAVIFVWLRFSAVRQLDWQRRYNTQPRELAHAQDRLTLKLSEHYASANATRPLLRLIAGSVGRGSEGQRVRDGILEIMHRHDIKEVSGHFLEEWHQKLHNNTTPDDVVICEAYLAFLRRSGDEQAFWAKLHTGGVSRERLQSYERPIRSAPDFIFHLREALLRDFGEFLSVLRALHAATDLGTAVLATRPLLDESSRQLLDSLWSRRDEAGAETWILQAASKLRGTVASRLQPRTAGLRELLYLDLALEDFVRVVIERNLHQALSLDQLLAWTELVLRNLCAVRPVEELSLGLRHMQRLWTLPPVGREWALHAQAVLERLRRELVAMADGDVHLLQPVAEHLGRAFGAADWSVHLFSEEVVRGRLDFVASALLRKLDEVLRGIAGLGNWQVVSRGCGEAGGVLEILESLAAVQGRAFQVRTILVISEIRGDEEIPEGVTALLCKSTVDLVSHVAVRARNAGVLLATCWDAEWLTDLRSGEWLRLRVTGAGDVTVERGEPASEETIPSRPERHVVRPPKPDILGLSRKDFGPANVAAKSRNLQRLVGRLPDWIHIPASVALPFGVCERVLDDPRNRAVTEEYRAASASLGGAEKQAVPSLLARLRDTMVSLQCPFDVEQALRTAMAAAGLPPAEPWSEAWLCVTRVWASKWNERAYWSRRTSGIPDDGLVMAVLIQETIAADYAFVIHTANPVTGDRDELFAELVPGLGETLVGNHPGRALGFCLRRGEAVPRLVSFPSKSLGLYGHGLIFRSDCNGEDLAGFAGAGLYDSFMLPPGRPARIDYAREELLWNDTLRNQILMGVARTGAAVEAVLGGAQDIEGVYAQGRFFVVQARPQVGLEHG
jgi:Phosphoenolpyruvate synthase/pyruvate phosphate dikinase